MPVHRSCSFCGNEIEPGTGKMFIKKDGTVFVFCSSKCQLNMLKLGRVPRWTPWTQAFRRAAGKAGEEAAAAAPILPAEEAPVAEAGAVAVTIDAPKGKDIPADLIDLVDKRLGPDLSRGDLEKYYADFLQNAAFKHAIVNAARKSHPGKAITHIEKSEFLAWKDTADGRRVFKAWLDGQWQKVKGRKEEPEEAPEAPKAVKKAKKGA
jgi:large subunit ribosomal protein L24e